MKYAVAALCFGLISLSSLTASAADFPIVLQWAKVIELSTPLNGKVSKVNVKPGDQVEKGKILATLDPRPYRIALKQAEADRNRTKAQFEEAQRVIDRKRELYDRTVLSTTELQAAELAFSTASADYHRAQAAVEKARLDQEYSQILAPTSGEVADVLVQPGTVVANRLQITPMIRLAQTDTLAAAVDIPLSQATTLKVGDTMPITIEGDRYTATIAGIALASAAQTSGAALHVSLHIAATAGKPLRPGQIAILQLP